MSKKKRTKKYRGKDSSITPEVIRIEAKQRSFVGNWWQDHKKFLPLLLLPAGIGLILFVLIWIIWAIFF